MVLVVSIVGCGSGSADVGSSPAAPSASKYEPTGNETFPEFATVEEAQKQIAFKPKVPAKAIGKLKKVVVRDVDGGKELPTSKKSADLHYESFWIAEAPFASAEEAAAQLDRLMSLDESPTYLIEVSVHGLRALAHDPVNIPLTENADGTFSGGLRVDGSSVVWVDGNMLYNMASDKLKYRELLDIAESMY